MVLVMSIERKGIRSNNSDDNDVEDDDISALISYDI